MFVSRKYQKKRIEHLSPRAMQHKVRYKKPFYIKKPLKCVKARCSELKLSMDHGNDKHG